MEKGNGICLKRRERLRSLGRMKLSGKETSLLVKPKRILSFSIFFKMDSGEIKHLNTYRVQHNDTLGLTKGGIRFYQAVIDLQGISNLELERLSGEYIKEIHIFIGPDKDVPAPDIDSSQQIMVWMVDEYAKIKGRFVSSVIADRPVDLGRPRGRVEVIGFGGAFILKNLNGIKRSKLAQTRIVVQGFGSVGSNIAKILCQSGSKVIVISDTRGGIHRGEGIDIEELILEQETLGFIPKIQGIKKITSKGLLELDCRVLTLDAVSDQINRDNASQIKAKVALGMANDPTTPEVDKALLERKIKVIPDIMANRGGVIVSYFKWIQNLTSEYWSEEKVFKN